MAVGGVLASDLHGVFTTDSPGCSPTSRSFSTSCSSGAGLAAFGATLTLPGIAGIILTVGMAVDNNVLIYERIREELRTGQNPARCRGRRVSTAPPLPSWTPT